MRNLIVLLALTIGITAQASYTQPPVPTAKGGTGSTSQTANRAVATDGSGHLVSSGSTTATELGYLNGVTSAIQTQFAGKAFTDLSNIAATALSADLICATSGSCKLGSAAKPFGDSYLNLLKDGSSVTIIDALNRTLKNTSGTTIVDFSGAQPNVPAIELLGSTSGHIIVKSGATPTNHTVQLPDNVCSSGQVWTDNGSGVMSCATVSTPAFVVTDGGNTAYTILSTDSEVRDTTTITADRAYTLPVCDGSNIGEKHYVKNLPAQTHNIILTADTGAGDNIDGAATITILPGDSYLAVCAAFSASGTWDLN